jgi:MFS family permease
MSEFSRGWKVIVAAAVGVGLGTTGLPIYTTGQFIRPLGAAFGWTRSAVAGGLLFLTIGSVIMAPIMGAVIERFGVRLVAMIAMVGLSLGYFGLTLNSGSIGAYDAGWAALAVLGAGTSPIVWTRAVASWFERARGLALGITLCGTGIVAVFGPGAIGAIIAAYGWKGGFYALSAAQLVIGLPLVYKLFFAREGAARIGLGPVVLPGITLRAAVAGVQFWKLIFAFFLMSVVVGGMIVNLPPMLADRGVGPGDAARALGLLGLSIIVGRLTIGWLVDRLPARLVAPVYIVLPAVSCMMLNASVAPVPAILLIGLAAGAEVDLLAYLTSRYFGMRHYAKIYGWGLSAFSAGAGVGPILGGWIHDRTGSYGLALDSFAIMVAIAACVIASLGRPAEAFGFVPIDSKDLEPEMKGDRPA